MPCYVNETTLTCLPNSTPGRRCSVVFRGIDYFYVLKVIIDTQGWFILSVFTFADSCNILLKIKNENLIILYAHELGATKIYFSAPAL